RNRIVLMISPVTSTRKAMSWSNHNMRQRDISSKDSPACAARTACAVSSMHAVKSLFHLHSEVWVNSMMASAQLARACAWAISVAPASGKLRRDSRLGGACLRGLRRCRRTGRLLVISTPGERGSLSPTAGAELAPPKFDKLDEF